MNFDNSTSSTTNALKINFIWLWTFPQVLQYRFAQRRIRKHIWEYWNSHPEKDFSWLWSRWKTRPRGWEWHQTPYSLLDYCHIFYSWSHSNFCSSSLDKVFLELYSRSNNETIESDYNNLRKEGRMKSENTMKGIKCAKRKDSNWLYIKLNY